MLWGWQFGQELGGGPCSLEGPIEPYNKNPDWYFGDEILEQENIKYSFKDYPDPNALNTKEFREFWKNHFD